MTLLRKNPGLFVIETWNYLLSFEYTMSSSKTTYLFHFRIQIQMEFQNLLKHQRNLWCRTWDFQKRSGRQSRLQIQELHYGKLAKLLAKLGKKWPKKKDKNMYEFITCFHGSWISISDSFFFQETSLKGFSASKYFVRNWIFSKSWKIFGNFWIFWE